MISREKKSMSNISVCSFKVDTVAEIVELPTLTTGNAEHEWEPCLHGSTALCYEDGELYAIKGTNTWDKVGE